MSRFLDTVLGEHHRIKIEAPQPYSAPHPVTVHWKPAIAAARGESATYDGIILTVRDEKKKVRRLYGRDGLVALLFDSEIESISEDQATDEVRS